MGCIFPILAISTIVASAVIIVVIIIILNRKWEAIKFFMFMHFDILPNDDGPENLDEMEFDAFVTYRSVNVSFIAGRIHKALKTFKFNTGLIMLEMKIILIIVLIFSFISFTVSKVHANAIAFIEAKYSQCYPPSEQ